MGLKEHTLPNGGTMIEWNGKSWAYYNKKGQTHREDGPALTFKDGRPRWFLEGKEYTEEEHAKEMQRRFH